MLKSILSRRAILAGAATASALAVPAVAAAIATPTLALAVPTVPAPPAEATPAAPIGPTQIDRLWKQLQATKREYGRLERVRRKLEAEVDRQMPTPHPSIMYGPEQEADGLKWPIEDRPPPDKFIWPHFIRAELRRAKYGTIVDEVPPARIDTLEKFDGPSLTGDQAALVERLTARLRLSERYQRKLRRVQETVGWTAIVEKMDKVADRQSTIEGRIASAKLVTRSDMARKLALYDDYDGEFYGKEIVRDLRRLFQTQTTLAA